MKKIDHDHMQEVILNEADIFSDPEYKKYRDNWTGFPEKFHVSNFPMNLDVHITNRCTLRCVMCRRTILAEQGKLGKTGFMELALYKKIIDEAAREGCCAIHITGNGEPLLHNDIVEMVAYAKEKKIMDVFMHSNATLLSSELSAELLKAGLTRIIFSFDSPDPEVYEKIRVGAKFDVVLENIKTFARLKKEMGLNYPLIRIQMVEMKENENQREAFDELFGEISDSLGHISYVNYLGMDKEDRAVSEKHLREDFICPQPWQRMSVEWDGRAYACLVINEALYLGHAADTSIKDMWHGKLMQDLRQKHQNNAFSTMKACVDCGRQFKA